MRVSLKIDVELPEEAARALLPNVSGWIGREAVAAPLASAVSIYATRDRTDEEAREDRADRFFDEEFS